MFQHELIEHDSLTETYMRISAGSRLAKNDVTSRSQDFASLQNVNFGFRKFNKALVINWLCLCTQDVTSESCVIHNVELIDSYSRRLFPAAYLLLNLIYWYYYIYCI